MRAHKQEESSLEPTVRPNKAPKALASKLKATSSKSSKDKSSPTLINEVEGPGEVSKSDNNDKEEERSYFDDGQRGDSNEEGVRNRARGAGNSTTKRTTSTALSETSSSEPERETKPQKVRLDTLNGMNMWLMCACVKKKTNASDLFKPNSGSRRHQGRTLPSRETERITQHDSEETISWDDDKKAKKEKDKAKKDDEGSNKMAKNHGSDKPTSKDNGKKTKKERSKLRMDEEGSDKKMDVMDEKEDDMKERKMMDEDVKEVKGKKKTLLMDSKTGPNTELYRKRKRIEEETSPKKFRLGTFQSFLNR